MCRSHKYFPLFALLIAGTLCLSAAAEEVIYGIGRAPSAVEISAWDIDVRFDGKGLPAGAGDVESGETLFEELCASCHGDFGQGEGRWPVLMGGFDSLTSQGAAGRPEKTVGSYWPYAPTLFDYIRRTMPYTAPQSLSDEETYALSAFVLHLNDIVEYDFVADADSLAAIEMPNRGNFFDDPRPDVQNVACMSDCLNAEEIRLLESIGGVTPAQEEAPATAGDATAGQSLAAKDSGQGKSAYMRACAVCHDSGVAGAPIAAADGAADWRARLDTAGLEGLIEAAINGKGAMPPQQGAGLEREVIDAAIRYMLVSADTEI